MAAGFFARLFGRAGRPARRDGDTAAAPMTCAEAAAVLQQYLDGEIEQTEATRVTAHLEVCRSCGLEAETYERIKATIATRRHDVPADAVDRLRAFGASLPGSAPGA